jgi:two-component system response regulator HydG
MPHLLIVDDDLTLAIMLRTWLSKQGFEVETASSVKAAGKKLLEDGPFDLVLSDLRLPDEDGLFLLQWMKQKQVSTPVIIMTSYAEVQNAVEAMKQGAADYIAKPVHHEILLQKIQEVIRTPRPSSPAPAPHPQGGRTTPPPAGTTTIDHKKYLEGKSEAARQLYNYVALVAPTPMSVLITGASGTGKEYVARRIHSLSKRADKPFVAIDCGAMLKDLAASEFFGHVKGAFTGAVTDKTGAFVEANGGTLFLDEVGNLSYDVQVQLLRALQERRIRPVGSTQEIEVDIRLVCATNENLPLAIERGEFREDLYHRINEFTLRMPALHERGRDILLFADFFLQQANEELERHIMGFEPKAVEAMMNYNWPGNLREMKNLVRRATLLAQDDIIRLADLGPSLQTPAATTGLQLHNEDTEKQRILQALEATGGNKSKAAQLLGVDRKTLYNKLKLYGL